MTTKHTPSPSSTPWVVKTEGFKDGFASIETEDGGYEVVLSCRADNAERIVKAVNCHAELVEALEDAQEALAATLKISDNAVLFQRVTNLLKTIRAAKGAA